MFIPPTTVDTRICTVAVTKTPANYMVSGASPGKKNVGCTHGEHEARAYNRGLVVEPPAGPEAEPRVRESLDVNHHEAENRSA